MCMFPCSFIKRIDSVHDEPYDYSYSVDFPLLFAIACSVMRMSRKTPPHVGRSCSSSSRATLLRLREYGGTLWSNTPSLGKSGMCHSVYGVGVLTSCIISLHKFVFNMKFIIVIVYLP